LCFQQSLSRLTLDIYNHFLGFTALLSLPESAGSGRSYSFSLALWAFFSVFSEQGVGWLCMLILSVFLITYKSRLFLALVFLADLCSVK